ncbi:MAG: hypothetical protein F6K55_32620 [Moorea sp. SIO4A3]|nr:hypothetical protein [Moorena sp. SIO4A3]
MDVRAEGIAMQCYSRLPTPDSRLPTPDSRLPKIRFSAQELPPTIPIHTPRPSRFHRYFSLCNLYKKLLMMLPANLSMPRFN